MTVRRALIARFKRYLPVKVPRSDNSLNEVCVLYNILYFSQYSLPRLLGEAAHSVDQLPSHQIDTTE
jgi:hypothetical protein